MHALDEDHEVMATPTSTINEVSLRFHVSLVALSIERGQYWIGKGWRVHEAIGVYLGYDITLHDSYADTMNALNFDTPRTQLGLAAQLENLIIRELGSRNLPVVGCRRPAKTNVTRETMHHDHSDGPVVDVLSEEWPIGWVIIDSNSFLDWARNQLGPAEPQMSPVLRDILKVKHESYNELLAQRNRLLQDDGLAEFAKTERVDFVKIQNASHAHGACGLLYVLATLLSADVKPTIDNLAADIEQKISLPSLLPFRAVDTIREYLMRGERIVAKTKPEIKKILDERRWAKKDPA